MSEAVHLMTHEFHPFRGGIAVYVEETARALVRAGVETTVWAPGTGQSPTDAFSFPVRRIRMRGKQDWLCRLRLAGALRRSFPDSRIRGTVILAEPGPLRLWMYDRLTRLPVPDRLVVILHGSEILSLTRPFYRLKRFRRLLKRADCVGVVSREVQDLLAATCPEASARALRVPGAVRSAWSRDPVSLEPKPESPLHVLQVGRLHPRKGQLVLVEAVARLPKAIRSRFQVRLVGPVGKSNYARRVQTRIQELQLPITVDGTLDAEDLKKAYAQAHVLVMPSRAHKSSVEGLGLTLLEAAHFGCAVVGSETGGIPEALVDGKTGLLVPQNDPSALASTLQRLLDDPDLVSRLGKAGSEFVRKAFSWDRNAEAIIRCSMPRE